MIELESFNVTVESSQMKHLEKMAKLNGFDSVPEYCEKLIERHSVQSSVGEVGNLIKQIEYYAEEMDISFNVVVRWFAEEISDTTARLAAPFGGRGIQSATPSK